jgi:site-specific DNA-adenine methylase
MSRYGLPYMGSKNQIAEWVVDKLPKATHFYDLFCGGCSITHCAMTKKKYKYYHINDVNPLIVNLFIDAINGKFTDEKRWISREDFFNLKEQDGYIKYCWSFGNKGDTYLYSKDIESLKKAAHYAIVLGDCSLMEELGYDLHDIENIKDTRKRYSAFKKIIKQKYGRLDLQSLESLQRLQSLESLRGLESYSGDYQDVKIEDDSVIYCDIPYINKGRYNSESNFDHERFYTWAEKQKNIFISEYWMPEDRFKCIDMVSKLSILSPTNNSSTKVEKIFIPINNEYTPTQLTLF